MRFGLSVLVFLVLALAPPVSGQTLTARLITPLEPMPGAIEIDGPYGAVYPTSLGPIVVPQTITPVNEAWSLGPLANITATTGFGATAITVPAQPLPMRLDYPIQYACSGGRQCHVIHMDPVMGLDFQLDSFTVTLFDPVPDPEGGCVVVRGQLNTQITAQNSSGLVEILAQPTTPAFIGPPPPEGYPPPVPETYRINPPHTARFIPPGLVRFEVCGDVPEPQRGLLNYRIRQVGSDWAWTATGQWEITVQDNGPSGGGHYALLRHVSVQNEIDGLLVSIAPGQVGWLHGPIVRVNDPQQEALHEMDPANNPPPEAIAYRFSFDPGPDLADRYTLFFAEPEGLPHSTGRINEQAVNNPAALALSYFFRENIWGPNSVDFPVTQYGPEETAPVDLSGPGGMALELWYSWQIPVED